MSPDQFECGRSGRLGRLGRFLERPTHLAREA